MSNSLAIATVTATLSSILTDPVGKAVPDAEALVTMARPDGSTDSTPDTGANIYLYQVAPNAAWRNADLPTRRPDGRQLVQRPRVALDLHYLVSFYGNEQSLQPQILLGSVVHALHARPVLTRSMIQTVLKEINDTPLSPLRPLLKSNLADAVELVKFTPLPFSLEELSKLWSVFFQVPYTLSVVYRASVVLIEAEETPQEALPVLGRNVYAVPLSQPVIGQIVSQAGSDLPIIAESTVILRGKQLRGDDTEVLIGGLAPLENPNVSQSEIIVRLPAGLRAGVQGAQVIHSLDIGTPPMPHRSVESNVAAFVVHPTIKKKATDEYEIEVRDLQGGGNVPRSAHLIVKLSPQVSKNQRVTLELLVGKTVVHRFAAAPLSDDTDEIAFPISGVMAGTYLVRVRVDGAESPMDKDENDQATAPKLTIL